jgi:hypothetical protein
MTTANTTNLKSPTPSLSLALSSAASSSASSSTTPITIKNGKRIKKNGFIYVSVKGKPEERMHFLFGPNTEEILHFFPK